MAIKLIYIAGSTHSGTTLLNRVLGAHPRIHNVGGLKNLPKALQGRKKCSCGAESFNECEFWNAIDRIVEADSGQFLSDLDVSVKNKQSFSQDNLLVLMAITKLTNCDVIVDSSRKFDRLEKLLSVPEIEIFPIHLFKRPVAQASSWEKRGKSKGKRVYKYWKDNRRSLKLLKNIPHSVWLSYEDFCSNPESECNRILSSIGIPYNPVMLSEWGNMDLHIWGGNRMQHSQKSIIRLDNSWQKRLSFWEKGLMHISCYPLWRSMKTAAGGL